MARWNKKNKRKNSGFIPDNRVSPEPTPEESPTDFEALAPRVEESPEKEINLVPEGEIVDISELNSSEPVFFDPQDQVDYSDSPGTWARGKQGTGKEYFNHAIAESEIEELSEEKVPTLSSIEGLNARIDRLTNEVKEKIEKTSGFADSKEHQMATELLAQLENYRSLLNKAYESLD